MHNNTQGQPARPGRIGARILAGALLLLPLLAAALASPARAEPPAKPFYAIAHQINLTRLVDWAVNNQGANAIESDLQFDRNGKPVEFRHGGTCDCSRPPGFGHAWLPAMCEATEDIVGTRATKWYETGSRRPLKPLCEGSAKVPELLEAIAAQPRVALFIVDSKPPKTDSAKVLRTAGRTVIELLEQHLFRKGYAGKVIVGTSSLKNVAYLEGAAEAARTSEFAKRIYFSIDEEKNVERVVNRLSKFTNQSAYGMGISAIAPNSYRKEIRAAAKLKEQKKVAMVYIWTIDRTSSMLDYIQDGADGVMTNEPSRLARLVGATHGVRLAMPSDELQVAVK